MNAFLVTPDRLRPAKSCRGLVMGLPSYPFFANLLDGYVALEYTESHLPFQEEEAD